MLSGQPGGRHSYKNGVALKEGDVIQRDDKVETKANSVAILTWSNGSMVEIYPETSFTFEREFL